MLQRFIIFPFQYHFMRKLTFLLLFISQLSIAQTPQTLQVREYRKKNEHAILKEYMSFLSIPNLASDTVNMQRNAALIMDMMKKKGIGNVQMLTADTKGIAPAIYGEVKVPGAKETIVFYAHYDGQPTDPSKWYAGLSPFTPQLTDGPLYNKAAFISFPTPGQPFDPQWRIYARGASDDKAGVISILNAYAAIISSGLKPSVNMKFFFEGEEEAGSDHLYEIFDKNKALLASDLWIICDGPVHQSGKKQVVFGVRGDTHIELTVYASKRPLHSGHYGNWAPNPAMELSQLLASMKNEKGEVTIKGFYDDVTPLTETEKKAIRAVPPVEDQMKAELGFIEEERKGVGIAESVNWPSLNINGLQSANVGKLSANVIPTTAIASIDLRLVVGNDWQRQQQKVIDHVISKGYHVVENDPTDEERAKYPKIIKVQRSGGYNAQKTALDLPIAQRVIAAVQSTINEPVVLLPTGGGSLPLFIFEKHLGAKTITVPVANHDNNQHAENENIRIRNLWDGLETMASLMLMK
jgi:acetylornithine deacetylase/succinyl-diaminopimelate desuccinylase-like protein